MKIAAHYHWLVAPGKIDWVEESIDTQNVGPAEVCCRSLYSAISPGTELSAFDGLEPLRPNISSFPRWLGYMNIAEVISAGSEVMAEFSAGTIVYTSAAHRSHFILDRSKVLAKIPDSLDLKTAVIAYLYRLALVGLVRGRGRIVSSNAIIGLGAIGQCAVELAMSVGSTCIGVSDHRAAQDAIRALGAKAAGKSEIEPTFDLPPTGQQFYEQVLVTTNSWRDWKIAMSLAALGGIISVIGFPGRGQPHPDFNPLTPSLFYDRQLTIASAGFASSIIGEGRQSPDSLRKDMVDILSWMASGRINPGRLVIGAHPAEDLTGAYQRLKETERGAGTIVLDWGQS